jgi:hypothetical protein
MSDPWFPATNLLASLLVLTADLNQEEVEVINYHAALSTSIPVLISSLGDINSGKMF